MGNAQPCYATLTLWFLIWQHALIGIAACGADLQHHARVVAAESRVETIHPAALFHRQHLRLIGRLINRFKRQPGEGLVVVEPAGMGRSEALRQVQLAMIRHGGAYSHPYYWAAFILAGDWRPLE